MADLGDFEEFWNDSPKQPDTSTEEAMETGERIEAKFREHGANKHNFYQEKQ